MLHLIMAKQNNHEYVYRITPDLSRLAVTIIIVALFLSAIIFIESRYQIIERFVVLPASSSTPAEGN